MRYAATPYALEHLPPAPPVATAESDGRGPPDPAARLLHEALDPEAGEGVVPTPSGGPGGAREPRRRRADRPGYDAVRWWLANGHGLLPALTVLCLVLAVLVTAVLWFQQGARLIAATWVWHWAWRWWRAPSGGAGGPAHTERYRAVMGSGGWRRRRAAAIRRAGRRCQRCGARGRWTCTT